MFSIYILLVQRIQTFKTFLTVMSMTGRQANHGGEEYFEEWKGVDNLESCKDVDVVTKQVVGFEIRSYDGKLLLFSPSTQKLRASRHLETYRFKVSRDVCISYLKVKILYHFYIS